MKRFLLLAGTLSLLFTLAVPLSADASANIKLKMPKRLDQAFMYARVVPPEELDVLNNPISFILRNQYGTIYMGPQIWGHEMKSNKHLTRFKYKQKRDGTPKIRFLFVRSRPDWHTGKIEYHFKIKIEASFQGANPYSPNNAGLVPDDLKYMYSQFVIGGMPFYINADWEWKRDKVWYLSDKMMSVWY